MTFDSTPDELAEKTRRIHAFLAERGFGGLLLTGKRNVAWATGGRDIHIVNGADAGFGHALFTADGAKYFLCTNNEEARLKDEEQLEAQGFEFITGGWHDFNPAGAAAKRVPGGGVLASDTALSGAKLTLLSDADIALMRYELTPGEVARYEWLGAVVGQATTHTAQTVRPGMTEHEVAAVLDGFLIERGVRACVTLVASDERILKYRHPIPTAKTVDKTLMFVTCVEAFGLIACATRLVSFGTITDDLRRRHEAVCYVDAVFNLSTVVGANVGDVFAAGLAAYKETGFEAEWLLHHQGGATGYAPRDYVATPTVRETVHPNQAFAWNPSISGTKTEDTIIATPNGLTVLTTSPEYPTVRVETPLGVMEKSAIWER